MKQAWVELAEPGFVVLPNPGLFSTGTQFRSSANPRHSGTGFFGGFVFWERGFIGAFNLRKADAFYPGVHVAAYGLRKYYANMQNRWILNFGNGK